MVRCVDGSMSGWTDALKATAIAIVRSIDNNKWISTDE